MDEFGVLVESIGFRSNGRSAPMAKSKPKPNPNPNPKSQFTTTSFHDSHSLPVDHLDGIFRSNLHISNTNQSQHLSVDDDDIFGISRSNQFNIDLDSVFSSSNNRKSNSSSSNLDPRGFLGFDDLLGSKSTRREDVNSSGDQAKKEVGLDDLLSGFGGVSSTKNGVNSNGHPSNSISITIDDPFLVFEPSVSQSDASWPFPKPADQDTGKSSSSTNGFDDFFTGGSGTRGGTKVSSSSTNGFDDFFTGGSGTRGGTEVDGIKTTANKPSSGASSNGFENVDYLDAIFGGSNAGQRNNATRPSTMAQNSLFDDVFHGEVREVKQTSSQPSFSTKKASSATDIGNDFTSLFGDVAASSGEFHEIEGEPPERRRTRLNNYMKTKERMAEALALKNQRDLQIQREQEEKRRLAETLDNDIKRWAAGKEGNLRALLSSLHQVLGTESGWRPVPLTDMITSVSVKKVYNKAKLYVHPDKVQQRGANLQQKYVAEKVFDILQEASNKFSAEELR